MIELICKDCIHSNVCALKNDMLGITSAIDNIDVVASSYGERVLLRDISWIKPVELKCVHYLRKEAVAK